MELQEREVNYRALIKAILNFYLTLNALLSQ